MFGLMGVARLAGQPGGAFSPLSLFASGEQGVWYDPSDFSTMFQDSVGTTPVTAVEQPVGLILDKRLGLVLGSELVTNGTFDSDISGWDAYPTLTPNVAFAWSAGRLHAAIDGSARGAFGMTEASAFSVVAGVTYAIVMHVEVVSGTIETLAINSSYFLTQRHAIGNSLGVGSHVITSYFRATVSEDVHITIDSFVTAYDAYFDNVSIKEIAGNHATQATAAARPVVSAPHYLTFDAIDDLLSTTFPTLGSACTIARAVPMVGASILTGQTIGAGTWTDSTNHAGLVIIDRALTAGETAALTAYLDAKAGV